MLDQLQNLTESERQAALEILKQFSEGKQDLYQDLLFADWDEIPVDIQTFLHDKNYLGNALYDQEGRFTLFPYWEEKLKEVFPDNVTTRYNTLVFTGSIGIGKAQPLTSPVLTQVGFKPMGEIQLGDQVYGRDGKLHKVVGVFPQGKRPVYKMTFTDGSSTLCSDEHLWEVYHKGDAYRRKKGYNVGRRIWTTNQLLEKQLYKQRKSGGVEHQYFIPTCEPIEFEAQDLPIEPYLLGCLLGDGHIGSDYISFTSADQQIVETLQNTLHSQTPEYELCLAAGTSYDYRLVRQVRGQGSNWYVQTLKNLGLAQNAAAKFIPQSYLYSDVKSRIALLQGLCDTDGTITKAGRVSFTTISPQLRDDVVLLVETLGGNAYWSVRHPFYYNKEGQKVPGQEAYEVTIILPHAIVPFRLTRKLERLRPERLAPRRYIHSIERVEDQECQCIMLDGEDHLYLTDHCIVTHNSTIAVICLLYLLYRLLCLKDPYLYYGLQPIDKISISLMNITLENAKGVAQDKMNQMILSSAWFMAHGKMTGTSNLNYIPEKHIEVITASSNNQVIGRAIFANFTDEVNFGLTNDVEKLKKKQKQLISQIDARMKSRFLRGNYLPTLNIIASSKNSDQSFLEDYIENKKKNESTTTLIVDEPQWVVDTRKVTDKWFYVAIGNKFLASELLPKDAPELLVDEYRAKGYSMLKVPEAYYESFQDNIDGSLADIAGIAATSGLKYISGMRWNEIKVDDYVNPFVKEIIEVGTEDELQYADFFDLQKVPTALSSKPMYIHLDMSTSGDKTGIAGVYVLGKRPKIEGEDSSRELFFQVAFNVSIKAPKGREISFDKNRAFIRWLRNQGLLIKGVSCDTFQSAQIQQQLAADGFDVTAISVDRLDSQTKQCLPYAAFKSAIYDKRLKVYRKCDLLTEEVIGLERESDGHINHPEGGTQGSKDSADAVCGALWNASQHAEEFAYSYGEDATTIFDVNQSAGGYEQLTVDFEEALKEMGLGNVQRSGGVSNQEIDTSWLDLRDGIFII